MYKGNLDQLWADVELIFTNAMYYNEPGSDIWKDAKRLKVCAVACQRSRFL